VELKSVDHLTTREESQIINYLAASKIRRGLLLNFGHRSLQYQRFLAPLRSQSAASA
jgi:GxxExxY protein